MCEDDDLRAVAELMLIEMEIKCKCGADNEAAVIANHLEMNVETCAGRMTSLQSFVEKFNYTGCAKQACATCRKPLGGQNVIWRKLPR